MTVFRIHGSGLGMAMCVSAMLALASCGGGPTTPTAAAGLATAADTALDAAKTAVDLVTDDSGDDAVSDADAKVAAAQAAVEAASGADSQADLRKRLEALKGVLSTKKTSRTAVMNAAAADTALKAAKAAVDLVTDDSGDATVSDADAKVAAAQAAVKAASDADSQGDLRERLGALKGKLEERKSVRSAAIAARKKAADEMMRETAQKLYAGISRRTGGRTSEFIGRRNAVFASQLLRVQIEKVVKELKKDGDAMVPAIKGWRGEKYALTDGQDTYEAYVYGDASENEFQTLEDKHTTDYDDTTGILGKTSLYSNAKGIGRAGFGITGGYKSYEGAEVTIKGTYYGIPGTFTCRPTAADSKCAARLAINSEGEEGVDLLGEDENNYANTLADWEFKADDPKAKITQPDQIAWSMYGWWLKKSGDGAWTSSAFYGERDSLTDIKVGNANSDLVKGKATYEGGSAGLYALTSHVVGTNDAGQFVADAMLEANFDTKKIEGTISNFRTGALGSPPERQRDWSVELMSTGLKVHTTNPKENVGDWKATKKTKWTIGGTAADASGNWTGSFTQQDGGRGGTILPKVLTGNFYSEYGGSGRMVGGFGTNLKTDE